MAKGMFLLFTICLLFHKFATVSPITMNQILKDSLCNGDSHDNKSCDSD